jgi:hypothetical protein
LISATVERLLSRHEFRLTRAKNAEAITNNLDFNLMVFMMLNLFVGLI